MKRSIAKILLIFTVIGGLLAFILSVNMTSNTTASPVAQLDDQTLTKMALDVARSSGLYCDPISQKIVRMTLGEWVKLNDQGLGTGAAKFGLTPDIPIFVLVIQGPGEYIGHGRRRPGQVGNDKFDYFVVALDARDGRVFGTTYSYPGIPRLIPIPDATPAAGVTPCTTFATATPFPTAVGQPTWISPRETPKAPPVPTRNPFPVDPPTPTPTRNPYP